jgi:esterase/lipase superfamily enzyme
MPIVRYGSWGRPLLLFPTANSDFLDCERFGLIGAVERHISAGRVTIFCIDSVNRHAWMNDAVPVPERARRQALYSGYVEEEVVPFIRDSVRTSDARVAASGASFGAFHAANAFFRRPDLFDTLIGMAGFYDLSPRFTHGYSDDNVYFNNPAWFVPNLGGERLEQVKRGRIHILSGQGAFEDPDGARRFSTLLWDKGIWNNLDLWGHDVNHDWPWWHKMLDRALETAT